MPCLDKMVSSAWSCSRCVEVVGNVLVLEACFQPCLPVAVVKSESVADEIDGALLKAEFGEELPASNPREVMPLVRRERGVRHGRAACRRLWPRHRAASKTRLKQATWHTPPLLSSPLNMARVLTWCVAGLSASQSCTYLTNFASLRFSKKPTRGVARACERR